MHNARLRSANFFEARHAEKTDQHNALFDVSQPSWLYVDLAKVPQSAAHHQSLHAMQEIALEWLVSAC